jgi:hypothetical protein
VPFQIRIFNNQSYVFAGFAACSIDKFEIHVLPLIHRIFAYHRVQSFGCIREDSHNAMLTTYARPTSVDTALMLIFTMREGPCISKMYLSRSKLPGVSERMWSVNLDGSISGEY